MIGRWAKESWIELRRHRLRSLLTAVGVAIAVTAFTLIAQVGELARRSISEELAGYEGVPGTIQVNVELPSGIDPAGRADLEKLVAERLARYDASTVAIATSAGPVIVGTDGEPLPAKEWENRCGPAGGLGPVNRLGRAFFGDGEDVRSPCETDVFGAGPGLRRVMAAPMVAGRWLTGADDRNLAVAAVLSEDMAKALVDVDHPTAASLVGSTLHPEGGAAPLVVVGVIAENPVTRQLGYPGAVFVAPKVAERLAGAAAAAAAQDRRLAAPGDGRPVGAASLRAYALVPPKEADAIGAVVATETTQYLRRQGMADASASSQRVDQAGELAKAMRILNAVLFGIAAVTIVVGALFVLIIALTSLRQRVQELGVRRAVGARPGDLAMLLLLESTVVALVGGAFGVFGAWVISKAVVAFTTIEESVEITSPPLRPLLFGMVVAAGTGMLAGLIPAWRAARLSVLDALRR